MRSCLSCCKSCTHRLLSSSILGLPHRILNINHGKELLRNLWVGLMAMTTSRETPQRRAFARPRARRSVCRSGLVWDAFRRCVWASVGSIAGSGSCFGSILEQNMARRTSMYAALPYSTGGCVVQTCFTLILMLLQKERARL